MTTAKLHRLAIAEARHERRYYTRLSPATANRFMAELDDCLLRIQSNPNGWPLHLHGTRMCAFRSLPFSMIYVQPFGEVLVVAVVHQRRNPGYWVRRLSRP